MADVKDKLTIRDLQARAVWVSLGRPVATKVGTFTPFFSCAFF